ncbi:MAG: prephenate dehydrogenase dimerization domain-containing protein [Cyanobacteria bacterium J06639_1]
MSAALEQLAQTLASNGFRDTSRIGGGNAELGTAMAKFNREEVLRSLQIYRDCLNDCIAWIDREEWTELHAFLDEQGRNRPNFVE